MSTQQTTSYEGAAQRIVAARVAAEKALTDLSNTLFELTGCEDDDAIRVSYAVTYGGEMDSDGVPIALVDSHHGDWIVKTAADIYSQIKTLVNLSCQVPQADIDDFESEGFLE